MPVIFEEAALQSVGSEIPDDRWPCFTLNGVTVLSESTKELVSLFSGHKNHAVCVVGYLEKIPGSHAHLGIYPPPLSVTWLRQPKKKNKADLALSKGSPFINIVT